VIKPENESIAECCQTLGNTSGYAKLPDYSRLVEVVNVVEDVAIHHCGEKVPNYS
jgi:hypothetical protein